MFLKWGGIFPTRSANFISLLPNQYVSEDTLLQTLFLPKSTRIGVNRASRILLREMSVFFSHNANLVATQ